MVYSSRMAVITRTISNSNFLRGGNVIEFSETISKVQEATSFHMQSAAFYKEENEK